jgi:hypothetical protein
MKCCEKELFTPGIKPRAFGYNVKVVVLFETWGKVKIRGF